MPPDPPRKFRRSKSRLPPTFIVGTSTSKLIDSTDCHPCETMVNNTHDQNATYSVLYDDLVIINRW